MYMYADILMESYLNIFRVCTSRNIFLQNLKELKLLTKAVFHVFISYNHDYTCIIALNLVYTQFIQLSSKKITP